jgi:hypothetical protein
MKIEGIDRVVIGVRDMDKAVEFFSRLFETKFIELKGPGIEALGERASISLDAQMELISPVGPLTNNTPPFVKRLAMLLEDREAVLASLSFRAKDTAKIEADAKREGIRIDGTIETKELDKVLSIRNLRELITNEEDTLGIAMSFVQYDRV